MSEQTNRSTGLTINWLQIAGGALAAITSAVALAGLKSLGTYGTLVGAAVGSIAASTAAAIYNHYLNVSRDRLAEAAHRARERRTGPVPTPQDDHPDPVDPPVLDPDDEVPAPVPVPPPLRRKRFRGRHAVLLGVAAFVLSVGGIFVYEQASGTSVAAERGGATTTQDGESTSIIGTPVTQAPATPTPEVTPTGTATDTATPTATESGSASESPTATTEATPTSSATATSSPTSARSQGASPTSSATAEPTTDPDVTVEEDSALAAPTGTPTATP